MAVGRTDRLISATVLKARFVIVAYVNDVCIAEHHDRAEQVEQVVCRDGEPPARIVFEAQRSGDDEHEEGSGGERWNYASVHLTECDESDRNSTEAELPREGPSRAWSKRP